jgi:hypothetical protein
MLTLPIEEVAQDARSTGPRMQAWQDRLDYVEGDITLSVIEAFIDESGTHKEAARVSVAAVIGAPSQWQQFFSHWGDKHFHAKENKYSPLKLTLLDAMQQGELESFVAWVETKDFHSHASAHFKSGLGNAYAVCAFASALGVCKFCKDNNLGKVSFVIEEGQPNVEFVQSALDYMKTKDRYGIASVAVAKKKDCVQLCTADFVAHSTSTDNEWFGHLWDTGRLSQEHITAEKLTRMSLQITEGLRLMRRERRLVRS